MQTTTLAPFSDDGPGWQRSLYAFLAEKERRSGSMRTVEGYSRMLQNFFGRIGKAPEHVSPQHVFAWAHGAGLSGRKPSAITIGARIACLSSFYRFLVRVEIVRANPCDKLERPRITTRPPRGQTAQDVRHSDEHLHAVSPPGSICRSRS